MLAALLLLPGLHVPILAVLSVPCACIGWMTPATVPTRCQSHPNRGNYCCYCLCRTVETRRTGWVRHKSPSSSELRSLLFLLVVARLCRRYFPIFPHDPHHGVPSFFPCLPVRFFPSPRTLQSTQLPTPLHTQLARPDSEPLWKGWPR